MEYWVRTRQIARGQKSELQKPDAVRESHPDTRHPKPTIPIFHHSIIPEYLTVTKPNGSDLAQWTRFFNTELTISVMTHINSVNAEQGMPC